MTTITIEKANFNRKHFVDEKDLFLYIIDYMKDLEDFESFKEEFDIDFKELDNSEITPAILKSINIAKKIPKHLLCNI